MRRLALRCVALTGLACSIVGVDLASAIGESLPPFPVGKDYRSVVFPPPAPLPKLVVYNIKARSGSVQTVTGPGDTDLLLVSPPEVLTNAGQINVVGFRGIYLIGATFDPISRGIVVSDNGTSVPASGALMRLQTSPTPVSRPFVYISRIRFKNTSNKCCDWLQTGGAAPVGNWPAWPDIYRYKMLIDPYYGWTNTHPGGSFSDHVNHADFMKFDRGGVRNTYTGDMDVSWGYQTEYLTPAFSTYFTAYAGLDGFGEHHFWNYVSRLQYSSVLGNTKNPRAFFLVANEQLAYTGQYYSTYLHEGAGHGAGVYVIPAAQQALGNTIFPAGGPFKPSVVNGTLVWPAASGYPTGRLPLVVGRLINGAATKPQPVVAESEVGWAWRITSAAALTAYTAKMRSGELK